METKQKCFPRSAGVCFSSMALGSGAQVTGAGLLSQGARG